MGEDENEMVRQVTLAAAEEEEEEHVVFTHGGHIGRSSCDFGNGEAREEKEVCRESEAGNW